VLRLSVAVISARLLEGKVLLESSVRIQGINRGKDRMKNPKHENRNSKQYQMTKTVLNLEFRD